MNGNDDGPIGRVSVNIKGLTRAQCWKLEKGLFEVITGAVIVLVGFMAGALAGISLVLVGNGHFLGAGVALGCALLMNDIAKMLVEWDEK